MTVQECINYLEQIKDSKEDICIWNPYTDDYYHIREIILDINKCPTIILEV